MKILLLASLTKNKSGNSFGGAEKSIINLATWLSENTPHKIVLASVEGNEKTFKLGSKVKYIGYKIDYGNKIHTHLQILKNTKEVVTKENPDFLISFWIHPLCYGFLTKSIKCKTIYSERNDPSLEYGTFTKMLRWYVLKKVDGVVFQTENAKRYFNNKIKLKSRVIHNPVYINKNEYNYPIEFDNRIVNVGRLNSQKNQKLLIEAFGTISEIFPEYHLEIYGDGPLRNTLQKKIECEGLENKVKLMGAHKDVINKICGARLFVLSSSYEGMPNALLESMAIGLPSISSDCPCGGPREVINDGINGYLFKVNSISSLVDVLKKALKTDPTAISENAKNICETHSANMIFSKWVEYINELYEI